MRSPFLLSIYAALLCVFAVGCSEYDGGQQGVVVTPSPEPGTTVEVLRLATQTDDAAEPFAVNGGAFLFNDTAEDSQPIAVNQAP